MWKRKLNDRKSISMREELRDPLRLDHIKDAIERLMEFDSQSPLEGIGERDLRITEQ